MPHSYVTHTELTGFPGFIEKVKPILPAFILPVVLYALWRMFRGTWKELDKDAAEHRAELVKEDKYDTRPLVCFAMVALILALQEYYGGRSYFDHSVRPKLEGLSEWMGQHGWGRKTTWNGGAMPVVDALGLFKYDELWEYVWWSFTRIFGYVVVPFSVWKILFRKDSLRDLGLRTKGFFDHIWIYGLFLGVVLPAMFIVARQPDFGAYYPFYKLSSRSYWDFLVWEAMYFAQFFALEMFFRGFWLGALRKSLGSGAIFSMAVPYCMIHFGKPYLEAVGAIVAGIALGSLSMKTKSIYQGFLVHITVAGLMDWLSLSHRNQLPHVFWPAG